MAQVSHFARLLAIALLNYSDDDGHFWLSIPVIRGALFPFDEPSPNIRGGFKELSRIGFLEIGDLDGKHVCRIPGFTTHQRIDRPQKARLSAKNAVFPSQTWKFDEPSPNIREFPATGTGNREQGTGNRELGEASKQASSACARTTSAAWTPHPEHVSLASVRNLNLEAQLARFRNRTGQDQDTDEGWGMRFTQWLGTGRPERAIQQSEPPKPRKPPKWVYERDLESLQSKRRDALYERNRFSPGTRDYDERDVAVVEIDGKIKELKDAGHE